MFTEFFYHLRSEGVPVSITEWLTLMDALDRGLARSSLTSFYHLARSILVKSESYYDAYDRAFLKYFGGIETPDEISEQVMQWLENALPPLRVSPEDRLDFQPWDLEELRRELEKRLREQTEQHHGGSYWIGTGGRSPFGHSGYHPAGVRIGGESVNRSAVKVAAERRYRDFRSDETIGIRQFELALRRLRRLSTVVEGPKDVLDLDATIDETCKNAGRLKLVWTRGRKNTIKVVLLMDSGGSMTPYARLCNQLFQAANRATHFKDLKTFYFHNCVYERVFTDPFCRIRDSIKTEDFFKQCGQDYKLIIVGDASMAPSELMMVYGAIDWNAMNEEPGIVWLERIARHFRHAVWLNPIPAAHWKLVEGAYTINMISQIFPMFELSLDGLNQAMKVLMVRK